MRFAMRHLDWKGVLQNQVEAFRDVSTKKLNPGPVRSFGLKSTRPQMKNAHVRTELHESLVSLYSILYVGEQPGID